jgi:hypothetical protein
MTSGSLRSAFFLAAVLLIPMRSYAADLTVTNAYGASVNFSAASGNLVVTLTNNWTGDPTIAKDILTAVFFNIDPSLGDTLKPLSAVICATCSVTDGGKTDPGGSVGGEWAYQHQTGGIWFGDDYGISAASLNAFVKSDLFPGNNLAGTANGPGGIDYGIDTKADTPGNDLADLAGVPLVLNQVIFTLAGLPPGFDPTAAITDVHFNYGNTPLLSNPVPEPASLALLCVGGVTAWGTRRRRRKQQQTAA